MSKPCEEYDFFPLSAISHYSFCPRRCALVHSERIWNDNYFTASGKELHTSVDVGGSESRKEKRFIRSLRLFSKELGVSGIADIVEFKRDDANGGAISGWLGRWIPYPVEYKLGNAKNLIPYERQLCAQAICLEEMFHVSVIEGALYLGVENHRHTIVVDHKLRDDTMAICIAIRNLLESGQTPAAQLTPYCKSCSLVNDCMPKISSLSAKIWLDHAIKEVIT